MRPTTRKPVEVARKRGQTRVRDLSALPLFFPLKGRPVLVAGGTAAAAWKAELIAAAGAEVHVYAEALSPEFEPLIDGGSGQNRIVHHARPWSVDVLAEKALAIADAPSDGAARAFFCAARAAGVPVNVIDNPRYCDFQFGSLVNRSPVVIGISTNGVAPILGQAIRRRIETLIPAGLSDWAAFAGHIRAAVLQKLAPGAERRRFWERFSDRAFSGKQPQEPGCVFETMIDTARTAAHQPTGSVTLVGAGPGDAEHLTLKAVRALQGADVILFDDLVDDSVLELARREAKRMLVGKRGGRESCRQEDINDLMVTLARQGKSVVRLKSGDPMIFGRAGEELARLEREGIPASVVPGVTAAAAMAARLGLSLTHRDHAQSVRFVTGHSRHGALPEAVDWRGLTDPATTTIFYMGGRMAGRISERLIAEGLAPAMSAIVMGNVSRPDERIWRGAVSDLEQGVGSLDQSGPILIGIGPIFAKENQAAALVSETA